MRRSTILLLAVAVLACGRGNEKKTVYDLSHEPVSVRGWVLDIAGSKHEQNPDMEIARRTQMFQSISLWVEGSEYSSGGIAENGAFIVLDVPPMNATIGFAATSAPNAHITMRDVPGNADVLIPDVILEPNGAKVLNPAAIKVRVPSEVDKATPSGKMATIGPYRVPIMNTPLREFTDRRDYPDPGGFRPVAIVK